MSPDDLASQELARWREQETKHQLEMIKKSELEMLSINRTYVLKTHKGEQVMEDKVKKVDSEDIIPGLTADSTSEELALPSERSESSDHSSDRYTKTSKHNRRDRDRKPSKDRRSLSKEKRKDSHSSSRDKRKRSRSRERDRSSHRNDRKRSRSRDKHRSTHKSSKHKRDRYSIDYLDKKSKEILDNLENNKIVPPEDRLWKHVPQQDIQETPMDSDSDHEPTSTVTIPTPPRSIEQEDIQNQQEASTKIETKVEVKPPRSDPRIKISTTPEPPKSLSPPPKSDEEIKEVTTPVLETKITSLSKDTIVWEGNINMIDVAKFFITMHEVR